VSKVKRRAEDARVSSVSTSVGDGRWSCIRHEPESRSTMSSAEESRSQAQGGAETALPGVIAHAWSRRILADA
jgi:hypothetical protein